MKLATTLATMVLAAQALVVQHNEGCRTSIEDLSIDLDALQADGSRARMQQLAWTLEAALCDLDDDAMSDTPTWEAASLAQDAFTAKLDRILAHEAANVAASQQAAIRRLDRVQGHQARNAVAQADAMKAGCDRRQDHRDRNAEEHFAAVALRAMKAHAVAETSIANDNETIALAA